MNTFVGGRLYGFYRALVVDAHDPKQTGRVKVHIPDIMLDKGWTGQWCDDGLWAHPANNMLGGRNTYDTKGPRCNHTDAWYQGQCMIPPKGSHVFLFFEKGDPSRPYYFAAADYGQTKVLPENRVGSAYEKKWTLFKSRLGRCIVVSDEDNYDGRVEITGKKRTISKTPDGDTKSVFDIDGNQTVFLIDERTGGHEKVLLKDYRGNYIKMIQDENGINDQLHVFMKDDIHIETPKNIFIKAGENIHITAEKNMYITALQNMYVKVTQNFREMAQVIDRYAEVDDKRFAGNNIQDKAANNIGQDAANNIYQTAISMCGRNCAGTIADMAGGTISYSGGGIATLTGGGGAFLNGPTTGVNNGQSPVTPPTGVTQAVPSIAATLPKPDPDRHFVSTDDGWEPVATEENPQNKCHQKFWKLPQWQTLSSPTQCKNAQVGAGGGGAASGCSSSSTSTSTQPVQKSSSSKSSSTNNSTSTTTQSTSTESKKSVSKILMSTVNEISNIPVTASKMVDSANQLVDNIKQDICNGLDTIYTKTQQINDNIRQILLDPKNEVAKMVIKNINAFKTDVTLEKSKNVLSKVITPEMKEHIRNVSKITGGLIQKHKAEFVKQLNNTSDFTQKNLTDILYSNLTTQLEQRNMYNLGVHCGNIVANNLNDFVSTNVDVIADNFNKACDTFMDISKSVVTPLVNTSTNIANSCVNIVQDYVYTTMDVANLATKTTMSTLNTVYDSCFETLTDNLNSFTNYVIYEPTNYMCGYMGSIYDNCCSYINENITEYSDSMCQCKQCFYDSISSLNVVNDVCDICNTQFNVTYNYCNNIVGNVLRNVTNTTSNLISEGVFNIINNDVISCIDNSVQYLDNTIQNIAYQSFSIVDSTLYTLSDITNNAVNELLYGNGIANISSDVLSYCSNNIIVDTVFDNINYLTNTANNMVGSVVTNVFNNVANGPINSILNNIPTTQTLIPYMNGATNMINRFVDMSLQPVEDITNVAANIFNGITANVSNNLNNVFNKVMSGIDSAAYLIDPSYVCNYVVDNTVGIVDYVVGGFVNTITNVVNTCMDSIIPDSCIPNYSCPSINYTPLHDTLKCSLSIGINGCMTNMYNSINNSLMNYFPDNTQCIPTDIFNTIFNDTTSSICNYRSTLLNRISHGEKLDIKHEMDIFVSNAMIEFNNRLNNISVSERGSSISNMVNTLYDTCTNVIEPISQTCDIVNSNLYDIINNSIGDVLNYNTSNQMIDVDILKRMLSNILIDSIMTDIKTEINKSYHLIPNSVLTGGNITQIDMHNISQFCEDCNNVFNNGLAPTVIESKIPILEESMNDCLVYSGYPTKTTQTQKLNNCIDDIINDVSTQFKDTITKTLILNDSIDGGNNFNNNIDYTKLYTIPGMPSQKHCSEIISCEDCDPSVNDGLNEEAFNPLTIGGCGCYYEYTLYLKNKFYNPIIWIMEKDSIKYTALSINPNLDNISSGDMNHFIDNNIINDHKKVYDHFFNDIPTDLENNLYIKRLKNYLQQLEILDFIVVINLLDFSCDNYPWLKDIPERIRYTHDMNSEKFKNYLKYLVDCIYYKLDVNNKKIRRQLKILLNIGNGTYDNKQDVNRELFDMYPNCGFMRDIVMYLTYDCGLTTNYMCISSNDKDNLYYYNPYTEFKSYDDFITRSLDIYTVCMRDCVDGFKNGMGEIITYNDDGSISGGYFKYLTECNKYSIPLSYIYDLSEYGSKKYKNTDVSILEHYTMPNGELNSNIMNDIYSPAYRSAVRYMYNGHDNYFDFECYSFNENSGELES